MACPPLAASRSGRVPVLHPRRGPERPPCRAQSAASGAPRAEARAHSITDLGRKAQPLRGVAGAMAKNERFGGRPPKRDGIEVRATTVFATVPA